MRVGKWVEGRLGPWTAAMAAPPPAQVGWSFHRSRAPIQMPSGRSFPTRRVRRPRLVVLRPQRPAAIGGHHQTPWGRVELMPGRARGRASLENNQSGRGNGSGAGAQHDRALAEPPPLPYKMGRRRPRAGLEIGVVANWEWCGDEIQGAWTRAPTRIKTERPQGQQQQTTNERTRKAAPGFALRSDWLDSKGQRVRRSPTRAERARERGRNEEAEHLVDRSQRAREVVLCLLVRLGALGSIESIDSIENRSMRFGLTCPTTVQQPIQGTKAVAAPATDSSWRGTGSNGHSWACWPCCSSSLATAVCYGQEAARWRQQQQQQQ